MATTTTTPAALISTPQKTTLHASGGVMAVATATGGFMRPPLLLAVPARVQAVVVAVPATAAPWSSSGRRGGAAMRLQQVAASGASGDTAEQGVSFYKIVEIRGNDSLSHLSEMLASSQSQGLTAKYNHVEKTLAEAVDMARAQDGDKLKIVLAMVRGCYGMLELACALYPSPAGDGLVPPRLPWEQDFITVCLAPKDRRKDVMTPPMESLLNLSEPKEMPRIIPELPETDLRFVETIFFATGVAMSAAKALSTNATLTYYSSCDGMAP